MRACACFTVASVQWRFRVQCEVGNSWDIDRRNNVLLLLAVKPSVSQYQENVWSAITNTQLLVWKIFTIILIPVFILIAAVFTLSEM